MEPYSLVRWGLDATEDDDLRFYFAHEFDDLDVSPEQHQPQPRWLRVHRNFEGGWAAGITDDDGWDLKMELTSFYAFGLQSFAMTSEAAQHEYALKVPNVPMPNGGAAYQRWVEEQKVRPTFTQWIERLYEREREDKTTGDDRLLLSQIEHEQAEKLRRLAERYRGRKGYVDRRAARMEDEERRKKAEEERKAREPTAPGEAAPPSKRKKNYRKWGELPAEPEIIHRGVRRR